MKATRGHLPWQNVDARLRSMREIWVATTSPKGRPDAVPVWFWWDGEVAYFTCKSGTTKPRNIAHEPNVVLHNGDGTDPIILKGSAERVTDDEELARVDDAYAAAFASFGSDRYRLQAERELRKLGHSIHRRTRPGKGDSSGVDSLTERELQIARLVVDRKTNPQIAAELFLSSKTVEAHLRNTFRKLGVTSRVEVAPAVERAERGP